MATVQGVKLKKGGTVVFPITHINAVKNENGQNLSEVLSGNYNTKSEISNFLNGKADTSHSHDDKYFTETEVLYMLSGTETSSVSYTWNFFGGKSYSLSQLPTKGVVYTITINASALGYGGASDVIYSPNSGKHIILGVSYSRTNDHSYTPNCTNINEYISKGYGSSVPVNTPLITGEGGQSGDRFDGTITIKMIRLA